jgi:6-pyruvoyltetrahydropterin/6-carboxytetrahydropterin synthase
MDFGGLAEFKKWSEHMFDHTLVIAEDDPDLEVFKKLDEIKGGHKDQGVCDLRIVPAVGCEMFAKMCYDKMSELLVSGNMRYPVNSNVRVKSVEVFEHGANSATYEG